MSSATPHFRIFLLIFGVFGVFFTPKTAAHLHCCIATVGNHLFSNDPSKSYQLVEAKFRIVCTVGTLAGGNFSQLMNQNGLKKLAELRTDPFFCAAKASGKISQLFFLRHPTIRHILVLGAQITDTLGTTLRHDVQLPESHRPISGVAQIHVIHARQFGVSHLIKKTEEN